MNREIKFRAWDKRYNVMLAQVCVYAGADHLGIDLDAAKDIYSEEALECDDNHLYAGDDWIFIMNQFELMQFTGLKDKNGKEIYEGDIIAYTRFDRPRSKNKKPFRVMAIVAWESGDGADPELNPDKKGNPSLYNTNPQFVARTVEDCPFESSGYYDWSEFHDCEIIGNIYENPELLNQQ